MRMTTNILSAALLAALASSTFAAECPTDKVRPHTELNGPTAPVKVSDTVIHQIDLKEQTGIEGFVMRIRRVELQPGGVVPQHSHAKRPAHLYIAEGKPTEHRSTCSVAITHSEGDVVSESTSLDHWWSNDTKEKAVIYSTDIVPVEKPTAMGEM